MVVVVAVVVVVEVAVVAEVGTFLAKFELAPLAPHLGEPILVRRELLWCLSWGQNR